MLITRLTLTLLCFQVHRLVVVDDEEHVKGIVSLSDILSFLILKPITEMRSKLVLGLSRIDGA